MRTCSLPDIAASAFHWKVTSTIKYLCHNGRKRTFFFLPSTLALFFQLWPLFKHQHTLSSAAISVELAAKITYGTVRREAYSQCWPMLRQRGIASQYPEFWHLRKGLADLAPVSPKPLIFRIYLAALQANACIMPQRVLQGQFTSD